MSQTTIEITRNRIRLEAMIAESQGGGRMKRKTYQKRVCDRAHTIFKFPVEEVAKALVLPQVLHFNLFQVATEGFGVKFETVGSQPNRQFERVEVPPQPREVPER
jgi:hypothetical protein